MTVSGVTVYEDVAQAVYDISFYLGNHVNARQLRARRFHLSSDISAQVLKTVENGGIAHYFDPYIDDVDELVISPESDERFLDKYVEYGFTEEIDRTLQHINEFVDRGSIEVRHFLLDPDVYVGLINHLKEINTYKMAYAITYLNCLNPSHFLLKVSTGATKAHEFTAVTKSLHQYINSGADPKLKTYML